MQELLMRSNEEQQYLKKIQLQEEIAEERYLVQQMQLRQKQEAAINVLRTQQQEEARQNYGQELTNQMRTRQQIHKHNLEKDELARRYEKEQSAYKASVVEEARRRLLQQHAAQLQGFLPKGVLQNESDYQ